MTFQPAFAPSISRPFAQAAAAVVVANWWLSGGVSAGDCVLAYQPKGAASLAASYSNLNNPGTRDAIVGIAPTWDATNGWIFNGSTQFLSTGYAIANLTHSVIVRYTGGTAATKAIFGANGGGTNLFYYLTFTASNNAVAYGSGTALPAVLLAGVAAVAGASVYKNGVFDVSITQTGSSGGSPNNIYIGAFNNVGTAASQFPGQIQAFAMYSTILTGPQVAAITSAMQAL